MELDWKTLFIMFFFISSLIGLAIPAIDPSAPVISIFNNNFLTTYVGDLRNFNWFTPTTMNPVPDPWWDVSGFLRGAVAIVNLTIAIYNVINPVIVFMINLVLYAYRIIFFILAVFGVNVYNFIQAILYIANLPFGIILSFILVTLLGLMLYGIVKGLIPLIGGGE